MIWVKFEMHSKYIMNKISRQTHLLSRLGNNLSYNTKLLLYRSLIEPHFTFCSTILNSLPNYLLNDLQLKQNMCMRIILKCNRYTGINTMLNTLDFLNVKETIYYNSLVMIFKIRNNFAPEYLKEKLKYTNEGGYYELRGGENFKIDVCKTNRKFNLLKFIPGCRNIIRCQVR